MSSARQPSPPNCAPQTRNLHGDEDHVLFAYESHARSCPCCDDPLGSARLCYRGIPLARGVVEYLYRRCGNYYACRNHEGDMTSRVHLPISARSARRLLTAVERGLLLNLTVETGPGAVGPDFRSVEIIERQPRYSNPGRRVVLCPFLCRRTYFSSTRSSHLRLFGYVPPGCTRSGRRKPRRSTIEVELIFHAEE